MGGPLGGAGEGLGQSDGRGMHCSKRGLYFPLLPTTTHAGFWRVWEKPDTQRPRPTF